MITGLAVVVFWSKSSNPRCTWQTSCPTDVIGPGGRCIVWDESFQDNYYFTWITGTPVPTACARFINLDSDTTEEQGDRKNWCTAANPALFSKVDCAPDSNAEHCYECKFRHSGDESHAVAVGFKQDCSEGFFVSSTQFNWQKAVNDTKRLIEAGCK